MSCGCTGKNSYRSYSEALENKLWAEQRHNAKLRIYQCSSGYWHLTSS